MEEIFTDVSTLEEHSELFLYVEYLGSATVECCYILRGHGDGDI